MDKPVYFGAPRRNRRRTTLTITAILVIMLGAIVFGAYSCMYEQAAPVFGFEVMPGGNRLLLSLPKDDIARLYTMSLDGSAVLAPWRFKSDISGLPSFSSDGSRVVFTRKQAGKMRIVTARTDGTGEVVLPIDSKHPQSPVFVNSRQIVYWSAAQHNVGGLGPPWVDWDLYLYEPGWSTPRRLTHRAWWRSGRVSVDRSGRTLFFSAEERGRYGGPNVYSLNSATGHIKRLTSGGRSSSPSLDPVGGKLAYISDSKVPFEYEIWLMDADGGNKRQVTSLGSYLSGSTFYRNGKYILFLRDDARKGHISLWSVGIDGRNLKCLAGESVLNGS